MYVDTHCHLLTLQEKGIPAEVFFKDFAEKYPEEKPFILDVGTKMDDFCKRYELKALCEDICGSSDFLNFSAGIWPDDEAVVSFQEQVLFLEKVIDENNQKEKRICAVGECGLDRHWNTAEKGNEYLNMECNLFAAQLEIAGKKNLPVIIHSRDDFDATYSIIKNSNCKNVIIHCFSYGKKEAEKFLDLGYYISFSGSITFGKKEQAEKNMELARYVPFDRLLLETDSPYMAPVPYRGKVNTPLLIENTYAFIAEARKMDVKKLCEIVAENARIVFMQ